MPTFRHISPERTLSHWPMIRRDVRAALDNSANTAWPEDVRDMLARGHWSLVLIENDGRYRGCIVLAVKEYPRKRVLSVVIVSGNRLWDWHEEINGWLEVTAQSLDCTMIELTGRLGWLKRLKKLGWNAEIVSMTFEVKQNGRINSVSTG
jgi:hypothetical protein